MFGTAKLGSMGLTSAMWRPANPAMAQNLKCRVFASCLPETRLLWHRCPCLTFVCKFLAYNSVVYIRLSIAWFGKVRYGCDRGYPPSMAVDIHWGRYLKQLRTGSKSAPNDSGMPCLTDFWFIQTYI